MKALIIALLFFFLIGLDIAVTLYLTCADRVMQVQ